MAGSSRKVKWSKEALASIGKALQWISEQSIQNAEEVEAGILEEINSIANHPEKYPPDRFKRNNPGNYRAFYNT